MNDRAYREAIAEAVLGCQTGEWCENAVHLLDILGYRSERTLALAGNADDFIRQFPASNENTKTAQAFRDTVQSVRILFQVTDAEITVVRRRLFNAGDFDRGNARSFLFAAVELNGASYPRGQYATFTREINKRFPMPTVVLFKTANDRLSLSFVHRREHKRDPNRDVLGHVSLIREINPTEPHRAQLDILQELSLDNRLQWMTDPDHDKPLNFDGLLAAWLAALDTEALNRRFFKEIADWYFWAVDQVMFPEDVEKDEEIRNATSIIRLITRLIFVWFMKEKGLVQDALFQKNRISAILKNTDPQASTYYKAILQNLFFATLNTEMQPDKRKFRHRSKRARGRDQHYMVHSLYRYEGYFKKPQEALGLFETIPFLNGGLFECLDAPDKDNAKKILRADSFSDRGDNPLQVPNFLFFSDKRDVDLNAAYGTKGKRYQVRGLIKILDRYKFTIAENTPIEEEVALDPELLGKVFENLLAAYNPETNTTARKQTGSFYTPREIVNYMVDESLIAYLKNELCDSSERQNIEENLRHLVAYNDEPHRFNADETEHLIETIDKLKILDPACGSGAFPMGVLQKLVFMLAKLDPRNDQWRQRQIARVESTIEMAEKIEDSATRENTIRDLEREIDSINEAFERNELDYGRKLYLIENGIYGVDIQPIAVQIAKLRFFISLIVDQKMDDTQANRGVRPLPNLETKFVAANALIGIEKPTQMELRNPQIEREEKDLADVRRRHFTARTPKTKSKYRDLDAQIRANLSDLLRSERFPRETIKRIASWDPYDQNTTADFFDPEWMFGIRDGFDVVIGNPPYIQLQKERGELGRLYKDAGFATFVRTGDIYQLFYEKGCQLLASEHGLLAYITSNSWLKAEYGKTTRRYFAEQHAPLQLLEMGKDVFENAIVDTNILIARSGKSDAICKAVDMDRLPDKAFPPDENFWGQLHPRGEKPWSALSAIEHSIMDTMEAVGTPLKEWDVSINYGIKTGYNDAFVIDDDTKEALVVADPRSAEIIKPVLRGRDIQRYRAQWAGLWLVYARKGVAIDRYPAVYSHLQQHQKALSKKAGSNRWYELQASPSDKADALFKKEKLFWMDLTEQGRFTYDAEKMFCLDTAFMMTGERIKYLCAVLNAKLIRWYLQQTAPTSGMGVLRWKKVYLETIPIPKISADKGDLVAAIVDYIIYLKKQPSTNSKNLAHARDYLMVRYFERIIDGLVYEIYLTDELHRADKYFFKPLRGEQLPSIEEITGDKMSALRTIFERLYERKHPVRKNLFFLGSLEVIRAIEESKA